MLNEHQIQQEKKKKKKSIQKKAKRKRKDELGKINYQTEKKNNKIP